MIKKKDNTLGIILEFKAITNKEKKKNSNIDLEKVATDALEQIHDKKYSDEFLQLNINTVYSYGIAFDEKDCNVVGE